VIPVLSVLSIACNGSTKSIPDLDLYPTWNEVGLEINYPDGWNLEKTASFEWRKEGEELCPRLEFTDFEDENCTLASVLPLEQNTGVRVKLILPGSGRSIIEDSVARKMVFETSGRNTLHVRNSGNRNVLGTSSGSIISITEATQDVEAGDCIILTVAYLGKVTYLQDRKASRTHFL
jgi:hypothetical protein